MRSPCVKPLAHGEQAGLRRSIIAILLICALPTYQSVAQQADTLRHYDLAEIVIGDRDSTENDNEHASVHRLRIADLLLSDAQFLSGALRTVPGLHIQVNSRGEAIPYLRNSGERQVALFLDGALLNIPWDYRFNLRTLPAGMIGETKIVQGVPSALYGTNTTGGVISFLSRLLDSTGRLTTTKFSVGQGEARGIDIHNFFSTGRVRSALGFSYSRAGDFLLPDTILPYSQPSEDRRTNSDIEATSFFGKLQVDGKTTLGLTLLGSTARFGVAPESHIDPDVDQVRFWRIPESTNLMLVGNAGRRVRAHELKATVWASRATQQIDEYADVTYSSVEQSENSRDWTGGVRLAGRSPIAGASASYALNLNTSWHQERSNGGAWDIYSQQVASIGAEVTQNLDPVTRLTVGGSLDGLRTPLTGDKPSRRPQTAFAFSTSIQTHQFGSDFRFSVGQRVRFPTMRELFGVALQRFLLNPDLAPERSLVVEAEAGTSLGLASLRVIPFLRRTFDTIDQQRVVVDGNTLRQRINLEGSWTSGVELVGAVTFSRYVSSQAAATFTETRVIDSLREIDDLLEKPRALVAITTSFNPYRWLAIRHELDYTGLAFGLAEDNGLITLPRTTIHNVRLTGFVSWKGSRSAELSFRVNNISDVARFRQPGLPDAGRTVSASLDLTF